MIFGVPRRLFAAIAALVVGVVAAMRLALTGGGDGKADPGETTGKSTDAQIQMIITEYNNLRQEQFGRTTAQQGLLALNLTGGAAFIAFAASTLDTKEDQFILAVVLLLLPILSSALALSYCEQHYSIMKVGLFLASDLEQRAREIATPDVFLWHTFLVKYAEGGVDDCIGKRWRRTFTLYMPACFFSPSAVAVALAILVVFQRRHALGVVEVAFVSSLAALALASIAYVIWLWMSSTKQLNVLQSRAVSQNVKGEVQGGVAESVRSLKVGRQ